MDNLRPCFVCKCPDNSIIEVPEMEGFYIECHWHCGLYLEETDRERLIKKWNTRPLEDMLIEALELLIPVADDFSRKGKILAHVLKYEDIIRNARAVLAQAKGEKE